MTLGELLIVQHRWGQTRFRRLLGALDLGEHKPVGSLTDRQRQALLRRLDASGVGFASYGRGEELLASWLHQH